MGQRVLKQFDGRPFRGAVADVDLEIGTGRPLYHVRYDDGDAEDLYEHELAPLWAAALAAAP